MEFIDIQSAVESVLEEPVVSASRVAAGNVNDVFRVIVGEGAFRQELYIKSAPDLVDERAGNELLHSLGIQVPVEKAFIADGGNSHPVLITEMVRGVDLSELCKEDPHKAITFFADAFAIFHSIAQPHSVIHGDFCLPNVIVQNAFTTPEFVHLDNSLVSRGSIWKDFCAAVFTIDFNTSEHLRPDNRYEFFDIFFTSIIKANRRLLFDGKAPFVPHDETELLTDRAVIDGLLSCYADEVGTEEDIHKAIGLSASTNPPLGRGHGKVIF